MPYPVSENIEKASTLLCRHILREAGGSSAIANSLVDFQTVHSSRQCIHKYIKCGFVPLKAIYDISVLLEVPVWALNYAGLLKVHGENTPPFHKVVEQLQLLPATKKAIMNMFHGK